MNMLPPDPEVTPSERRALNAEVKRTDATGFRDAIPGCPDFEYLCQAAEKAGWIVHLTTGGYIEKPREDKVGRRTLASIRLKRNATAVAKISVPVEDNLALASRIALDQLIAQAGKS